MVKSIQIAVVHKKDRGMNSTLVAKFAQEKIHRGHWQPEHQCHWDLKTWRWVTFMNWRWANWSPIRARCCKTGWFVISLTHSYPDGVTCLHLPIDEGSCFKKGYIRWPRLNIFLREAFSGTWCIAFTWLSWRKKSLQKIGDSALPIHNSMEYFSAFMWAWPVRLRQNDLCSIGRDMWMKRGISCQPTSCRNTEHICVQVYTSMPTWNRWRGHKPW